MNTYIHEDLYLKSNNDSINIIIRCNIGNLLLFLCMLLSVDINDVCGERDGKSSTTFKLFFVFSINSFVTIISRIDMIDVDDDSTIRFLLDSNPSNIIVIMLIHRFNASI